MSGYRLRPMEGLCQGTDLDPWRDYVRVQGTDLDPWRVYVKKKINKKNKVAFDGFSPFSSWMRFYNPRKSMVKRRNERALKEK